MAREGSILSAVRTISKGVEVLPEVRDYLATLDAHLVSMSDEVTRMRQGVDRLESEVKKLNQGVDGLDENFVGLRGDMRSVDEQLTGLRKSLAPLGNALGGVGKLGNVLRGNGGGSK